jgi:hypothetical protein
VIPVGADCRCGHPLVWRDGGQWCAVYGSHVEQPVRSRPPQWGEFRSLVTALDGVMDRPDRLARRALANRDYRARLRAVPAA